MPQMGIDSLKNNLTNPARPYLWEIIIPAPIGGGDAESLSTRCQSTSEPGRSVGEILVPYKQTGGVKFAGKLNYDHNWECTFVEGEDNIISDAIYAWNQRVINDYDGVGVGDDAIKQDIYLHLLDTKGNIRKKVKLVGCYPQSVSPVDLNYDTEDAIKMTVVFSYDRWEYVS